MMGNFIIAKMKREASPSPPIQFILLISVPHVFGLEIEVRSVSIVAEVDMAMDSVPKVAILIKFGPVTPHVYLQRDSRNLPGQGSFLGRGVPAGYQAENDHQQEYFGLHRFTHYRTKVFPLVEGPLLP
jgi:hypothetical protein